MLKVSQAMQKPRSHFHFILPTSEIDLHTAPSWETPKWIFLKKHKQYNNRKLFQPQIPFLHSDDQKDTVVEGTDSLIQTQRDFSHCVTNQ